MITTITLETQTSLLQRQRSVTLLNGLAGAGQVIEAARLQAIEAAASATEATLARDAAVLSAGVYASTAAGLAATASGDYFSVPSASSDEYLILYKNNAGVAALVQTYPSAAALTTALTGAQTARTGAELAETSAETAQANAEAAQTAAEVAQAAAELAQAAAEDAGYAAGLTAAVATATAQATISTTKAGEAAGSAAAALASLTDFKGRWYGPLAADPILDPNGNAIGAGDAYWNTAASNLRVYSGSAWVPAFSDSSLVAFQQSGTGAVGRTVQEKAREWVTPQDFGAKADGVTDDSAALAAALATGRPVDLTDGTYAYSTTLTINGQPFVGRGIEAVTLKFTGSSGNPAIILAGGVRTTIGGFRILRTSRGIGINIASRLDRNSRIEDIETQYVTRGINGATQTAYSAIFRNIEVDDYTEYGLYLNDPGATGCILENIYCVSWQSYPTTKNNATAGVFVGGSWDELIVNQLNAEHANLRSAIQLNGVRNLVLNGLHVEGVNLRVQYGGFIEMFASYEKAIINGVSCVNNSIDSGITDVCFARIEHGKAKISGVQIRNTTNNMTGGTVRRFYRGTSAAPDPSIVMDDAELDIFTGNDNLPTASGDVCLKRFNGTDYGTSLAGYTYSALPTASANNGKRVRCSNLNCDVLSNGSAWLPANGMAALDTESAAYGIAPSGTIGTGAAGHWTAGTALGRTHSEGLWLYLGAVASTPDLAAGWYWVVMSSATVGTIYTAGPGSAAYSFSAGAANTGVTTEQTPPKAGVTIPGNSLGSKGQLDVQGSITNANTAGNKIVRAKLGGNALLASTVTTGASSTLAGVMAARGTGFQFGQGNWVVSGSGSAPATSSVDTTADTSITYSVQIATATDWVILERTSVTLRRSG